MRPRTVTCRSGRASCWRRCSKTWRRRGLDFPPVPTYLGATVGGIIATNAAGAATFKYGTTRDWVHGLTVVLPAGDVIDVTRGEHRARRLGDVRRRRPRWPPRRARADLRDAGRRQAVGGLPRGGGDGPGGPVHRRGRHARCHHVGGAPPPAGAGRPVLRAGAGGRRAERAGARRRAARAVTRDLAHARPGGHRRRRHRAHGQPVAADPPRGRRRPEVRSAAGRLRPACCC